MDEPISPHHSVRIRKDEIAGDIVHIYDGIEEADNELPAWWIALFVGAFVFGIAYWFAYHEYRAFKLPGEAYIAAVQAQAASAGTANVDALMVGAQDGETIAAAKTTFATHCVACHGVQGQGVIGPNLTDDQWIHGGSAIAVYTTIKQGILTKGMPSWGPVLGEKTVQQLASFVVSLRGQNIAGKAPEGAAWSGPEDTPAH
jgi:cytochrome c oxidase cbb3-type subunit 3